MECRTLLTMSLMVLETLVSLKGGIEGYLEHYITDYIADLSNIDDDDSEAQNNFVGFTTETGDS